MDFSGKTAWRALGLAAGALALAPAALAGARDGVAPRGDRRAFGDGSQARSGWTAPVGSPAAPRDIVERAGYRIESGPVDFGALEPGVARVLPAAVRVRVFAGRDWVLKMMPDTPLHLIDGRSATVPHSRLSWRSPTTGGFVPAAETVPAVVARGTATGPAGQLVVVDLRMELGDRDEIGRYGCNYRLALESY